MSAENCWVVVVRGHQCIVDNVTVSTVESKMKQILNSCQDSKSGHEILNSHIEILNSCAKLLNSRAKTLNSQIKILNSRAKILK